MRIVAYEKNKIIGEHITKFTTNKSIKRSDPRLKQLFEKESLVFDSELQNNNGLIIPVNISAKVVSTNNERIIQSFMRDITERKKEENLLHLHGEITKNMMEGIYLISIDDGIIRYTNPKFESMFGYDSGEMLGKNVSIVNAPGDRIPEETRDTIVAILKKTGEWYGEVNNIKKDGTLFWCYANCSMFDHPEYGKIIVAVHTDITERKQAEETLKENEDRYRQIYQFSPDSIIIHDLDMNILDVNNKAVEEFGYSKKELLEMKVFELHPKTELKHSAQVLDVMKKKDMLNVEIKFLRKDSSVFLAEATPCKYTLRSKPIIHVVIRDITERKKAEEELARRMHTLERFNRVSVDRELKMMELKKKILELEQRLEEKK